MDATLGQMAGPATREVMRREFEVYGDGRFARLAHISIGHLYNLRKSTTYLRKRTVLDRTRPTRVAIGARRPPRPDGRPGFVRVDTVHQGDLDGNKGVYLINVVVEVTQFEYVGAVAAISERFLVPVLEGLLDLFPFAILGFHADNGSEYINHRVAALLAKLHAEFTKSRPRHSNDNALAEGKNASVVRKWFGHAHIPRRFAPLVDRFARDVLSRALNFHRPRMFPVEHADEDGRLRKRYPHDAVMTPCERLKSLHGAGRFLKPGVAFADLDRSAHAASDLAAMREVNPARQELFRAIASTTDGRREGRLTPPPSVGPVGRRSAGMVPAGAPRKSRRSSAAEPRTERGADTIPAHSVGSLRGCQGFASPTGTPPGRSALHCPATHHRLGVPTSIQASRPPLTAAPLRGVGARR